MLLPNWVAKCQAQHSWAEPQGVVELLADHVVCREGETLSANQAAVLRIFDVKMAAFRLRLIACWQSDGEPSACQAPRMSSARHQRVRMT